MIDLLNFDISDSLTTLPIHKHSNESNLVVTDFAYLSDIELIKQNIVNENCKYIEEPDKKAQGVLTTQPYKTLYNTNHYKNTFSIRIIQDLSQTFSTYSHRSNIGFNVLLVPGFYSQHLVATHTVAIPVGMPKYDEFFNRTISQDDILKNLPINKNKPNLIFFHVWHEGHTIFRYWHTIVSLSQKFNILIKPLYSKEIQNNNQYLSQKRYKANFHSLIRENQMINIDENISVVKLLAIADVVLADSSSSIFLESCFIADLPTIGLQSDIPSDSLLLKNKLEKFSVINKIPDALPRDIDYAIDYNQAFSDARSEFKEIFVQTCDGDSGKKTAEIIEDLINEHIAVQKKKNKIIAKKKKRNILWFCIDGLRPDKLNCCGNKNRPELFIDELLLKGSLFSKVFSASRATGTAMKSIFSSMYLSNLIDFSYEGTSPYVLYITDILKHYGYKTFFYDDLYGSPPVPFSSFDFIETSRYPVGYILQSTAYTCDCPERIEFISKYNNAEGSKFIYTHIDILHELMSGDICSSETYENSITKTSKFMEGLIDQYSISKEDIVIFSTDHGIALDIDFRAKEQNYGPRHEESQSMTFCSFRIPEVEPQKIDRLVRSIDIAPTILDAIGYPHKIGLGRSLMPLILGEKYRPIWALREYGSNFDIPQYNVNSASNYWAVRTERWKYVQHIWREDSHWLIDLKNYQDYEKNLLGMGLPIEKICEETLTHNLIKDPLKALEINQLNHIKLSKQNITPEISFIIPVMKRNSYLFETISELFRQRCSSLEILIIDVERSDNTRFLFEQLSDGLNIFYYRSEGLSLPEMLNLGVEKARGKYISFAMPGAFYDNYFIYHLKKALDNDNSYVLSVSDYALSENPFSGKEKLGNLKYFTSSYCDDTLMVSQQFQWFCMLIHKKALVDAGKFSDNNKNLFNNIWKRLLKIGMGINTSIVLAEFPEKNEHCAIDNTQYLYKDANHPKVSVILPVYNDAFYFNLTLQSILAQRYNDFEVIIVDNGINSDISKQIQLIEDERIHLVFHKSRELSILLNMGIRVSKGKYLTWICSYSLLDSKSIEVFVKTLEDNPNIDIVHSAYAWIDNDNSVINEITDITLMKRDYLVNYVANYSFMYRKVCHKKIGFFDYQLEGIEDFSMLCRLYGYFSAYYIKDSLCYRYKNSDMIQKKDANIKSKISFFWYKTLIKNKGNNLNIFRLYPSIKFCKDKNFSIFLAFFDFGSLFFRSQNYYLAKQMFIKALTYSKNDYTETTYAKINMTLSLIKYGDFSDAYNMGHHLSSYQNPEVKTFSEAVIEGYDNDYKTFDFVKFKIFLLDRNAYELFQLENSHGDIIDDVKNNQCNTIQDDIYKELTEMPDQTWKKINDGIQYFNTTTII